MNEYDAQFVTIEPNSKRWFELDLLPNEEFRNIKGYESLYQISNYGRIKSLKRTTTHERILTSSCTKRGYCRVNIYKNGKPEKFFVHRLVMGAFNNNYRDDEMQVNHKDENKKNNVISNLEWCDNVYNINYGSGILRSSQKKCKPVAQYTMENVFVAKYNSIQDASIAVSKNHNKNGVHHVSDCAKGYISSYMGFKWRFID